MPVANYNRKILDLKKWVMMTTPAPIASAAGALVVSSRLNQQRQMFIYSATAQYLYYPFEDAFIQIPSAALAGTFGAGACGAAGCVGPSGNALAGAASAAFLPTNLTLARSLKGYRVQIISGPGTGDIKTIKQNTTGANAIIEVDTPFSATPTTATVYRLLTPRWYVLCPGTLAAGSFKVYDFATNTWSNLSITGLPATWGTDGKLVGTPSYGDNGQQVVFATGTATGGGASVLTNSAKTWAVNTWANYQLRITGGTGAGQIRTIASNTGTQITVATPWTIQPDATSTYVIEGNDDFLYLMGNNAVTLYRYQISTNTWTTIAPIAARAAAPGLGMSGHWVFDSPDPRWTDESAGFNGARIYSFRGGAGAVLDYYDIAANTWVSGVLYAPATEVFGAGSKYVYADGSLFIHKDATGRWFRFDFADAAMVGWSTNVYPGGAAVAGDTAFDVKEPETGIRFIMMQLNTSTALMRCMIV